MIEPHISEHETDSEKESMKGIVKEIEQNLKGLNDPDFGDAMTNMLTHLDYGFSISEPVFDIVERPDGLRAWLIKLKTRAPHTFTIHTDDYGNVTDIEQDHAGGQNHLDPKGLILMIHQVEFGIPYGTSDLQSAYRAWFSKDIVVKFWNIYSAYQS